MRIITDHITRRKDSQGKIIHLSEVDSTNDWVKQHLNLSLNQDWLAVRADAQLRGRGRFDRHWISPPNQNIYVTYLFFIDLTRSDVGTFALVMAVALTEILAAYGIEAKIKWPNDVEVNGEKIAGILTETVQWDHKRAVICGIGLNVNMERKILDTLNRPATSMRVVLGQYVDLDSIFLRLTEKFQDNKILFTKEGFFPFRQRFTQSFFLKPGESISISNGNQRMTGLYQHVCEDGSIEICQNGLYRRCYSGEIQNT